MIKDLKAAFEKVEDEYIEFERIENPICKRPDICAFLLLEKLAPGSHDMIFAAIHDELYLAASVEDFANAATEEDVLFLTRCGVSFDGENEYFTMFV